ncbi:hypothetical protein [Faecalibaculum rodentium]|uniref:hypothetical protein n=1 Tax=Faecalibaculum rodentium TaxID=1702221 RepID=UPI0025B6373C|nr:hypothetical protein [Faecalibaculum rodentium]
MTYDLSIPGSGVRNRRRMDRCVPGPGWPDGIRSHHGRAHGACREDMQAFLFAQKAQGAPLPQASGDITAQDAIRRYSLPYASGNMEEITVEA